jgi:Glycosyltransferase family 87
MIQKRSHFTEFSADAWQRFVTSERRIFSRWRLQFYGSGVLAAYAIGLVARLFQHSWIFHADAKPSCIDFSQFWVSGSLALSADPTLVYDDATFSAARAALAGADACMSVMNHFVYPPNYLFFTYPLGLMPYVAAFAAWTAITLLLYLVAIYLIVPRPIAILVALSPFPVFFNFFLGQNELEFARPVRARRLG